MPMFPIFSGATGAANCPTKFGAVFPTTNHQNTGTAPANRILNDGLQGPFGQ